MSEGFLTTARTAELFFRMCIRYHIKEEKDRLCILREITRRKKAKYLRDVDPFLQGKRVLKVGFKPPHNTWDEHHCPECGPKENL
jgi:hypothetical protein